MDLYQQILNLPKTDPSVSEAWVGFLSENFIDFIQGCPSDWLARKMSFHCEVYLESIGLAQDLQPKYIQELWRTAVSYHLDKKSDTSTIKT